VGSTAARGRSARCWTGVGHGRLSLAAASAAVSSRVAERLRLRRKGALAVGRDADITIVDLTKTWTVQASELRYRHPLSALVGTPMRGEVGTCSRAGDRSWPTVS
jgi:allantoinase